MAQNIIKHVKDMVADANSEVKTTPIADASNYYNDEKFVLYVDFVGLNGDGVGHRGVWISDGV